MSADSRPLTEWEPFEFRGRPFLRTTVFDLERREGVFRVAQPIAGRYEVNDVFAVGENGVLLHARDLRTQRPVVVKALRSDATRALAAENESLDGLTAEVRRARHLLQTERRLLVRLRNAGCNAVPTPNDYAYDLNPALERLGPPFDETEPYLILQQLSGMSLEELLTTRFPSGMEERRALELIAPVVKVLEVLHEPWRLPSGRTWHCVYQDLKPANIVVDPLGRATLLDFGGCQVVVDGVPVLEGSCTSGYSPPECAGPARVLLPCADVFGIGSTLYHMLTGIDPRDRLSRWRGRPGEHLDLRALPSGCSPGLRDLLRRCLAPRPSDRLANARQVSHVLATLGAA